MDTVQPGADFFKVSVDYSPQNMYIPASQQRGGGEYIS